MKENKYDQETFFKKYSAMDRSVKGLEGAGEWAALEPMLPPFAGKRVLDLGCGFGWHCQYAMEHGAKAVAGVDISARMLARARKETDPRIQYVEAAIEDAAFGPGAFDVALSSLAFHYLADFDAVAAKVYEWLAPGGDFVFSCEHPVFTAYGDQDWYYDGEGRILHFPVDRYFEEGERQAVFLGEPVVKYHRTLQTYLRGLSKAGFTLLDAAEPRPTPQMLAENPAMADELRRPMMLILSARK